MKPLSHVLIALTAALLFVPSLDRQPKREMSTTKDRREEVSKAPAETRIRIAKIAVPAPRLVPPQSQQPPARSTTRVAPISPDADLLSRGEELLRTGLFPRVHATCVDGFQAYRDLMVGAGARFYLFDDHIHRPVAEIHPKTGALLPARVPTELSRWPRDVSRHFPSALSTGRTLYGDRAARVVMLPPSRIDAALLGAVDEHLLDQEVDPSGVVSLEIAYRIRQHRLYADLVSITMRDGTRRPSSLVVELWGGRS